MLTNRLNQMISSSPTLKNKPVIAALLLKRILETSLCSLINS